MFNDNLYVISFARTAIGSFQGMFSSVPATKLGAEVIKEAVERAGLKPQDVDEVFMGCVLTGGVGQAPARQAALFAGLPESVPCTTIKKVCGSGMQSIIMGARAILSGEIDIALCGGMENMTMAPYALPKARGGYRIGNGALIDTMINDGLWDVYNNFHMGTASELCAREFNITREMQDDYAVESYKRALSAQKEGIFKNEIVPVTVKDKKKGEIIFDEDEEPRKFIEEKFRKLKPAFEPDGTITAGNASSIADAAAAVVVASEKAVKKFNLNPVARIVSWSGTAQEPKWFTTAPVPAMRKALEKANLKVSHIDFWEINEAFAVVAKYALKEMGLSHSIVNIYGGACALGHPIGATGARLIVTMLNVLQKKKAKKGCVSMCIGGGEALAMIVEMV